MKNIYLVGNCYQDSPAIKRILEEETSANVEEIKTIDEAESKILDNKNETALVIVNRIDEYDHKKGLELVDFIKEKKIEAPIILLTNYKDKQEEAKEHGACPGFGKSDILEASNDSKEYKSAINLIKKYLRQ